MTNNKITCPICGKEKTWRVENLFRPFCSERCKLIDLGEWACDQYKIPGNPAEPKESSDENE